MGITRLVYALFATMKSKRADGRDMSVMACLRQLRLKCAGAAAVGPHLPGGSRTELPRGGVAPS